MIKKVLKIGVSIALLGFLLYKEGWESLYEHISRTDPKLVLVVLVILVAQFPISAYKWGKSLNIHELDFPFAFLLKMLCIGFFFNNFLPTSIGGDGYRAMKTVTNGGLRSSAISAILLERILGFGVLLFLGLIGAVVAAFEHRSVAVDAYILAGALSSGGIILGRYVAGNDLFGWFLARIHWIHKFDAVHQNLQLIRSGKKNLAQLIEYSIAFQLLAIVSILLLFQSIGVQVEITSCAFIAAFAGIASILPISINGIGVVEGSFVFSALQVGIPYDDAIVVALMLRALTIPLTIASGFVYLYESMRS